MEIPRPEHARLITPSKITAWLDCEHFLALQHQVEDGLRAAPTGGFGAFAQLLADKGIAHEKACLEEYERRGRRVLRVDERGRGESFAHWIARIGDPFGGNCDVIYQMPFVHDGIRGIADFLVRAVDDAGVVTWEPVDAKLARQEAKPGHVLQLCFYADAIEAATGHRPVRMHLWLGSGRQDTLAVVDFAAYWRRLKAKLSTVLAAPVEQIMTVPEPCDHCAFCAFAGVCEAQWRAEDSLIYVAGLRASERTILPIAGVSTLAALAGRIGPIDGVRQERQARIVAQAALQYQARQDDSPAPPYMLVAPDEAGDPWGHGFELLPEPDDGDVFLDFEGHPFWRADTELFFLLGLIERDVSGYWTYRTWWAHTQEEEQDAALGLIECLTERRQQFPGMHVYHYNHTERSSLERLAAACGVGEVALTRLVSTGAFVDLFAVARNAVQVGTESYGLKALERLTDFERSHDIDQGAGAVVEYEAFMAGADAAALERIARYNEDDVRATRALRDWLVQRRPADLPWRAAELQPDDAIPELDEQVARLHAFGPDTVEHLLGDVTRYWRREWSAHLMPLRARCVGAYDDLLEDPDALAGLASSGVFERVGSRGQAITPGRRFMLPKQETAGFAIGDGVVYVAPDGATGYSQVLRIDVDAREVDLTWSEKATELGFLPSAVVRNGWVSPNPKPAVLSELAADVLDGRAPNPVALALLRRDLPTFVTGGGPSGGRFADDLNEMVGWATQLDHSFVAIQGPPGTGKTFRGAHLVRRLVKAGQRVGITAMSHSAIDNLLRAVVEVFSDARELPELRAVKRGTPPPSGGLAGVRYATGNSAAARTDYNLVAGTTWLFAGNAMHDEPVDVLLVDEAGQLSLADALAASRSARNLILLGDPLQLPQVAQADHPGGAGDSVLEHVLGNDATVPTERGVFLTESRRMHPDICTFISDEIYEGRLTSHPSCTLQTTDFGTGLRWLQANHAERVTESPEEVEIVAAQIERLIGTVWTDQNGKRSRMGIADILVVAPYNDQVALLRRRLDGNAATRGVPVGTVDKFQGQEAAVVFFTMTTSTAVDVSRSANFLFSRNRFNVAISRARCLAYLVCTEELLDSRGRDVQEMRLISTLCSFVERAAPGF